MCIVYLCYLQRALPTESLESYSTNPIPFILPVYLSVSVFKYMILPNFSKYSISSAFDWFVIPVIYILFSSNALFK